MKIGEYEQMMAYLKDPFNPSELRAKVADLDEVDREEFGTGGGPQLQKVNQGGFKKGDYYFLQRNPKYEGVGSGTKPRLKIGPFKTFDEANKKYLERQEVAEKLKGTGSSGPRVEHAKTINKFVNNFFDENINKFELRDYDKFEKALKKAFNNSGIKDYGSSRFAKKHGLPNIGLLNTPATFSKYGIRPFNPTGVAPERDFRNFYKKLFYVGQIENNPALKKRIGEYLDYYNTDKKYYKGSDLDRAALRKKYSDTLDNAADVLFILGDDKVGEGKFRSAIVKNFFPEKMQKFLNKKSATKANYAMKTAQIENKLSKKELADVLDGETSIKAFMQKQSNKLKEIFDLSSLDDGLRFNLDHAEGMSEIAQMENKKDIKRALKNLVGMTSSRNYELGWRGYSTKRKNLLQKINQGTDVKTNLAELNKLTNTAYPETKGKDAYKIINDRVVPTKSFKFMYEPETAFRQYFSELVESPKGKKEIFRQLPDNTQLQDIMKMVAMSKKDKGALAKELDKAGVKLTKSQKTRMNELGYIDADLLKDIGRTAGSGALKTLAALDIPILQLGFASMTDFAEDNPLMTTIPLMFTDEASKLTGLYNQSGGNFKKFMRLAARAGVPLEKAKTIFPMISKVGRIGSLATPALETVQEGYKAARNVSRAKEEARNFGIPEEQAMEGLEKMYALNRPVVGDYMDAPEMSERGKANLESLKRGFQQFGSFFGLSKDPYAMREQKAEGDKPKGAAKMTRRTFLKLASLVPAVLTGAAAIRFGPAKTKKIFTAIENLKDTTTKLPTWFKGFADKFRNTGDSVNIYKKQKVPISKGEYERAELAKEANVYSDTARTLDYKKNNPHHMDYYRLVDTDELVGTTYTNKDMPGIQIDDFADGELSVKFENDYSQESELVYVKPGSKYSDYQVGDKRYMYEQFNPEETSKTKGDFIAYDSQPISTTPDGDYDIDAVVVDDVGNMLEGTTRSMEEYYTGKPVEEISAGEKQIMRAEMRAEDTPDDD